ncbi:hypothetical protein BGZ65_012907 [Modicella reniformis]|uniref:F-box domain-containing protein n=1 Tax=Modicella reniformis TaxID=1440133 RepID=A0A9P6M1I0_9FUNG|nr:hypothetical protein BGZ65_012907 [Modicella reniformis]
MNSSISKALQLPEILHAIAHWVPLFEHEPLTSPSDELEDVQTYTPHHLLSCTLVSRLWNTCFTPHLYHYFVDWNSGQCFLAFRKHNCHFRRYLSYRQGNDQDRLPFETSFPPRYLVGLFVYGTYGSTSNLLLYNQGPQLRQLTWRGWLTVRDIDQVYQDALANLPCLEELELSNWVLSNELMYRILSGCAGTLRKLKLETVNGFDDGLFLYNNGSNSSGMGSRWVVPHMKSLRLQLGWTEPRITVLLPQLFPALESIYLAVDMEQHSIPQLASILRENCPKLNTIHYEEGYSIAYEHGFFPEPEIYASLFKDSFSSPGLQCATMALPDGLDHHMMEALLFHASTLVTLEMMCSLNNNSENEHLFSATLEQAGVLLTQCVNLKDFRLLNVYCSVQFLEGLLITPWRCCGLEQLTIEGYESSDCIDHGVLQYALQHHAYRDVGQGWFLKPSLDTSSFEEALIDGDLKHRLFEHMYTTSGIKHATYVKLDKTEFFAQEQV